MSELQIFTDEDKWKVARTKAISATEMSILLGLSYPGNSIKKLVEQKRTGISPALQDYKNRLIRGVILEPSVVLSLSKKLGWIVSAAPEGTRHFFVKPKERIAATPDCYREGPGLQRAVVECKSVGVLNNKDEIDYARWEKWQNQPPEPYIIQVLHQMRCTDTRVGYIAGMLAMEPMPLVVYRVELSDFLLQELKETTKRFWNCFDKEEDFKVNKDKKPEVLAAIINSVTRIF